MARTQGVVSSLLTTTCRILLPVSSKHNAPEEILTPQWYIHGESTVKDCRGTPYHCFAIKPRSALTRPVTFSRTFRGLIFTNSLSIIYQSIFVVPRPQDFHIVKHHDRREGDNAFGGPRRVINKTKGESVTSTSRKRTLRTTVRNKNKKNENNSCAETGQSRGHLTPSNRSPLGVYGPVERVRMISTVAEVPKPTLCTRGSKLW